MEGTEEEQRQSGRRGLTLTTSAFERCLQLCMHGSRMGFEGGGNKRECHSPLYLSLCLAYFLLLFLSPCPRLSPQALQPPLIPLLLGPSNEMWSVSYWCLGPSKLYQCVNGVRVMRKLSGLLGRLDHEARVLSVCVCAPGCNVHVHQVNNKRRWVERGPGSWGPEWCFFLRCQSCNCQPPTEEKLGKSIWSGAHNLKSGLKHQCQCLYVIHSV